MRILIATDAFPPTCGGSGWSTYELAKGLRARGHEVRIVQPRPGQPIGERTVSYDGLVVLEIGVPVPDVPFVRTYFKNERFYPRLARRLAAIAREEQIDLIHAQHVLTAPPAVEAGGLCQLPVVCTVRDYWPVCYWSTLINDFSSGHLCPECSPAMMSRCVRPRAGLAWPLALPMIPYMRHNLARKRHALARADAILAVSTAIARDLKARAPELAAKLEIIPNPVDVEGILAAADRPPRPPVASPYAIYVGKLAANKGVGHLLAASDRARLTWPLIVVGDGPERASLEAEARRLQRDVRFTGWLPREDTLAWLRHASLLIFPSYGPESLSRVLLEAAVLGVPIAAMDTGGTRDIITHQVSGLLSQTREELARDIARHVADEGLRAQLAESARRFVTSRFAASVVIARTEALYRELQSARHREVRRA